MELRKKGSVKGHQPPKISLESVIHKRLLWTGPLPINSVEPTHKRQRQGIDHWLVPTRIQTPLTKPHTRTKIKGKRTYTQHQSTLTPLSSALVHIQTRLS